MVWDQLISNVVEREYTSSPHKENIQLPYATKTEPAEICTRQIQLDVNIVLINISNLHNTTLPIHQTYTCKSMIIPNTRHYILACSLHGLSPQSWSTSDYEKMMEYTGSSLQTADGLGPVDLQCCGKGIYLKSPPGEHSAPICHKDRANRNLYMTKFGWMSTLFSQIYIKHGLCNR